MSEIDSLASDDYIKLKRRSPEELQDYLIAKFSNHEMRLAKIEVGLDGLLVAHNYRKPAEPKPEVSEMDSYRSRADAFREESLKQADQLNGKPKLKPKPTHREVLPYSFDMNEEVGRLRQENEQLRTQVSSDTSGASLLYWQSQFGEQRDRAIVLDRETQELHALNQKQRDCIDDLRARIAELEKDNENLRNCLEASKAHVKHLEEVTE